jgi:hypothetical protein
MPPWRVSFDREACLPEFVAGSFFDSRRQRKLLVHTLSEERYLRDARDELPTLGESGARTSFHAAENTEHQWGYSGRLSDAAENV